MKSINSFIFYCTDKNNFSDTSSNSYYLDLPENIDNNEDMIKTTDSNNLIISENSGLKSDEIRAYKTFIEQKMFPNRIIFRNFISFQILTKAFRPKEPKINKRFKCLHN